MPVAHRHVISPDILNEASGLIYAKAPLRWVRYLVGLILAHPPFVLTRRLLYAFVTRISNAVVSGHSGLNGGTMRSSLLVLASLALHLSPISARANCPLYGPLFPRPTKLLQDATIKAVAAALDDGFVKSIDQGNGTGSYFFSYAIEVFTGSEDAPLWSHYWTAPSLKSLNSTGVSQVDTNTVFRIGSVTKIFTVLTFLATVGDGIWNDPITKHLPDIEEIARNASGGPIYSPDWESITVGSLASQMSGLIRDCMSCQTFVRDATTNTNRRAAW